MPKPFTKPSDIPHNGITPESLAKLSGVDLSYIQGRTLPGRTQILNGKISKRDALILLRDAARAERDAERSEAKLAPVPTPNTPKSKAVTSVQMLQRVGRVADMLAQMIPNRQIRSRLSEEWGVTPQYVEKLIEQAYAELAGLGKFGGAARKDQMRDAFAEFYQECMSVGNLQAAAMALDRLAKIDGVYAEDRQKIQHDVSPELAGKMNAPDAIRERIAELVQKPELVEQLDKLTRGK